MNKKSFPEILSLSFSLFMVLTATMRSWSSRFRIPKFLIWFSILLSAYASMALIGDEIPQNSGTTTPTSQAATELRTTNKGTRFINEYITRIQTLSDSHTAIFESVKKQDL